MPLWSHVRSQDHAERMQVKLIGSRDWTTSWPSMAQCAQWWEMLSEKREDI